MEMTIELRQSPMLLRPSDLPSLCSLLAFSLTERFWVGAGYELIQDYDAVLWTSEVMGHKPIVMSGIRTGAWYRGGYAHHGWSWAAGGLLTFAHRAISLAPAPDGLDQGTFIVDYGVDFSIGHVWQSFRIEGFATPAWSYGRVSSPRVHQQETYSGFTYRIGVALAVLVGS